MNINSPMGFRPISHGGGGIPGRLSRYSIASGYANDLFTGDLVTLTGTDRNIAIGVVATGFVLGSFEGCRYVDAQGNVQFAAYWPSGMVATGLQIGEEAEALVADDPDQLFIAQVDDAAGLASGDIGQTADFVAGAGNVRTGMSGQQIDQSSFGSSQQLRIVDLYRMAGNDFGQYAKAVVRILNHVARSGTAI